MRGALRVDGVQKRFGSTVALHDVTLAVEAGHFVALLGPSGCGKTTLLRLIAGLESPDAGRIILSGADVTAVPAHRRPVNTVFQHYALFPHRDVLGNVGFGLQMAGVPAEERRGRAAAILDLVRLTGLERRPVSSLSGGQRQRVALARALVLEPEILLLDEPLAALDWQLRDEMQGELKALQRRLGTTFVFVTHSQEEALALGDRVVLMNAGRVEQVGTPEDLYERPGTVFAAGFLGVRNVLAATVLGTEPAGTRLRTERGLELVAAASKALAPGARVHVAFRPERFRFEGESANAWPAVLEEDSYRGDGTEWRMRVGGERLVAVDPRPERRRRGETVCVALPPEAVIVLESDPR